MVNTKIRLILFFAAKDGDSLYNRGGGGVKKERKKENKTGSWMWLKSWTTYCQIQIQIEEITENH